MRIKLTHLLDILTALGLIFSPPLAALRSSKFCWSMVNAANLSFRSFSKRYATILFSLDINKNSVTKDLQQYFGED